MGGELSNLGRTAAAFANATNSQKQAQASPQLLTWAPVDHPVTNATDAPSLAMDVLKPFLLLACVAFTIGFVGYWALDRALTPVDAPLTADTAQAPITTSAPDTPLADGKRI